MKFSISREARLAALGLASFFGFVCGIKVTFSTGPALMALFFPFAAFFFWGEIRRVLRSA